MFTTTLLQGVICVLLLQPSPQMEYVEYPTPWGFYGHKLINRMAVFTLPKELLAFYKPNIEYVTQHAVDPDKRRYATRHEAVRHYIDLDNWGEYPFNNLSKNFNRAIIENTRLHCATDTGLIFDVARAGNQDEQWEEPGSALAEYLEERITHSGYADGLKVKCSDQDFNIPESYCQACDEWEVKESFTEHGILPYHLRVMQSRLTAAFRERNAGRILQLSAEIGHYIGDAHVPLHTSKNYNGQLTGQEGIHAFWESRIPELFAENEYDFLVGRADYIRDQELFFWQTVFESHLLVDEVLDVELQLSQEFPVDRQFCYHERLEVTVRTQCPEYAKSYQERMDGMVEKRMRDAIHAVGSSWFTAWVDAGQPDVPGSQDSTGINVAGIELDSVEMAFRKGSIKGREHH